jgi:HEAT repeat protein
VIHALRAIKHADVVPHLGNALANDASPMNREAALETLAQMGYITACPYLYTALVDDKDPGVRQKAAIALATIAQDQSIPALKKCLSEDENENVREAAAEALGLIRHLGGVAPLCQALEADQSENVRRRAALSLGEIGDVTAIPVLSKVLAQNKRAVIRYSIIQALSGIDHVDTIAPLVRTLLEDDDIGVPEKAAIVMQAKGTMDWQEKANQIIRALQQGKQQRSDTRAPFVLLAMQPPQEQLAANSHLRTDFLIEKALDQDDRMTAILAKLIIDSASESVLLAGERINSYEKTHQTPPDKFRKLRIEIGGETALDPIMQVLQDDLQIYFRKPISELNQLTQNNWQKTILYAQYGFLARITMSIVVFIVGMVLLSISSWRIMFGQLDQAQLFGAGISFVSGLGSMLLVIYRGPLREIRESVNDLGIASAAFIAYIHRVLQISHTFSFHYLKQQITFEALEKSSKLIKDAMDDTTGRLQAYKAN